MVFAPARPTGPSGHLARLKPGHHALAKGQPEPRQVVAGKRQKGVAVKVRLLGLGWVPAEEVKRSGNTRSRSEGPLSATGSRKFGRLNTG